MANITPLIQYDPDSGQLTVATKPNPTDKQLGHPLLADPCGCLSEPLVFEETCHRCGHWPEIDPRRLVLA